MVFPQQCEKKRKIARCCAAASVSVFALTLRLGSGGCGLVCRWTTRPFERRLAFPPNVLLFIIFLDAASFSDIDVPVRVANASVNPQAPEASLVNYRYP